MNKKKKHEREQIVREINKAAQLYKTTSGRQKVSLCV